MVNLNRIVSLLEVTRQELLLQLGAIDKAIAALGTAPTGDSVDEGVQEAAEVLANTSPPLIPTRVKPKRVLGDAHKQALTIGRRKAREAKDAAAGLAREMPDDSFVPALGPQSGNQPARLVKRHRNQP